MTVARSGDSRSAPTVFTDVRARRSGQCRDMATDPIPDRAEAEAALYAGSLRNYAASSLDPFSLRCWIIRRVMLDLELGHDAAERVCDRVLAKETAEERVLATSADGGRCSHVVGTSQATRRYSIPSMRHATNLFRPSVRTNRWSLRQ